MGPRNAIIGDDYGTDIPVTKVDTTQLVQEQKAARYSKTKEYKELRNHWLGRIEYYQKFLPSGQSVLDSSKGVTGNDWIIANSIIAELTSIMNYYDNARSSVNVE